MASRANPFPMTPERRAAIKAHRDLTYASRRVQTAIESYNRAEIQDCIESCRKFLDLAQAQLAELDKQEGEDGTA